MRSEEGLPMRVKTSNLNEDLGRIQQIFTVRSRCRAMRCLVGLSTDLICAPLSCRTKRAR